MVSEPDIERCASKEAEPRRGWIRGSVPVRTLDPKGVDWECQRMLGSKGGWIVRSHIGWGGEPSMLYKDVETSP